MQARTALIAALACGALAVAVVAADVAWSLEARLETHQDGSWETVAAGPFRDGLRGYPGVLSCSSPELRVTVHNDRPVPANDVHVRIAYNNLSTGRDIVVLDERWDLAAFAARDHAFTIPESAFPTNATGSDGKPAPIPRGERTVFAHANVGQHIFLQTSVCLEAEA